MGNKTDVHKNLNAEGALTDESVNFAEIFLQPSYSLIFNLYAVVTSLFLHFLARK